VDFAVRDKLVICNAKKHGKWLYAVTLNKEFEIIAVITMTKKAAENSAA
jgi:hypothetical protein